MGETGGTGPPGKKNQYIEHKQTHAHPASAVIIVLVLSLWTVFVSGLKGDDGKPGDEGAQGPPGPPGNRGNIVTSHNEQQNCPITPEYCSDAVLLCTNTCTTLY